MLLVDHFFAPASDSKLKLVLHESSTVFHDRVLPGTAVGFAEFSPSGDFIAYSSSRVVDGRYDPTSDVKVSVANEETLTPIFEFEDGLTTLNAIAFSPDGTKLAVLTGPDFRVYDIGTGLRIDLITIADDIGTSFAFSPDGDQVYIGTLSGKIDLIDLILVPPMTEPTEAQQ